MDSIRLFLQEDTEELGLVTKTGGVFISKLERSNFHPALSGIITLMFKRNPGNAEVKTFLKLKENYPRIKSQFVDNLSDSTNSKAAKKSNVVWFGFDHTQPNLVQFKMEYKKLAWKGAIDIRQMKVQQDIESVNP